MSIFGELAMSPHKILRYSLVAVLIAALGTSPVQATEYSRTYAVTRINLPTTNAEALSFAIDVNGDGVPDNNIGSFLAVFSSLGSGAASDLNSSTNAAIANGSLIHSLIVHSADAQFHDDPSAQVVWYAGPPSDNTYPPVAFSAALADGTFASADPATTTDPVELPLLLVIGPDLGTVYLQRARLSFTVENSGQMQGQINGAILHADLLNQILPMLVDMFNAVIQSDPTSQDAQTLLNLFDTGCSGSGAHDGSIQYCELSENPLMQTLMAPDVQVRDANGNYADANSIGLRFTAIFDRVFANGFE
jgi:hypothetical protein